MTEFFSIRDGQTREEVIRKYIKDDDDPAARQFTIVLKGSSPFGGGAQGKDRPIGRIVLADIEEGWKAELWRIYIADTSLRGHGLGKQALLAIMDYCLRSLLLSAFISTIIRVIRPAFSTSR